jgi:hypothetical protein
VACRRCLGCLLILELVVVAKGAGIDSPVGGEFLSLGYIPDFRVGSETCRPFKSESSGVALCV